MNETEFPNLRFTESQEDLGRLYTEIPEEYFEEESKPCEVIKYTVQRIIDFQRVGISRIFYIRNQDCTEIMKIGYLIGKKLMTEGFRIGYFASDSETDTPGGFSQVPKSTIMLNDMDLDVGQAMINQPTRKTINRLLIDSSRVANDKFSIVILTNRYWDDPDGGDANQSKKDWKLKIDPEKAMFSTSLLLFAAMSMLQAFHYALIYRAYFTHVVVANSSSIVPSFYFHLYTFTVLSNTMPYILPYSLVLGIGATAFLLKADIPEPWAQRKEFLKGAGMWIAYAVFSYAVIILLFLLQLNMVQSNIILGMAAAFFLLAFAAYMTRIHLGGVPRVAILLLASVATAAYEASNGIQFLGLHGLPQVANSIYADALVTWLNPSLLYAALYGSLAVAFAYIGVFHSRLAGVQEDED